MAVPKYLKRYFKVQRNEMPALFKITERIPGPVRFRNAA
jgi:putative pyruvate formate lyase activating enzyme